MNSVHSPISRFAAFLLLAAAIALPASIAFSPKASHALPAIDHGTLTADGTLPTPPPRPIKA